MRPTTDPRLVNCADVPHLIGPDSVVLDLAKSEIRIVNNITHEGRAMLTTGVVVALDRLETLR